MVEDSIALFFETKTIETSLNIAKYIVQNISQDIIYKGNDNPNFASKCFMPAFDGMSYVKFSLL
jgi:hypothetical protein